MKFNFLIALTIYFISIVLSFNPFIITFFLSSIYFYQVNSISLFTIYFISKFQKQLSAKKTLSTRLGTVLTFPVDNVFLHCEVLWPVLPATAIEHNDNAFTNILNHENTVPH